jgi:hypothetical protein
LQEYKKNLEEKYLKESVINVEKRYKQHTKKMSWYIVKVVMRESLSREDSSIIIKSKP